MLYKKECVSILLLILYIFFERESVLLSFHQKTYVYLSSWLCLCKYGNALDFLQYKLCKLIFRVFKIITISQKLLF